MHHNISDLMKMKSIDDLVDKDQASTGSNVLNALKSRYCCLSEPLTSASRPDNNNGSRRYFTQLWVFGSREVDDDDDEPLPSSFSKLLEDENSIDPQRVKDKITHALSAISLRDPHVLVQFWSLATVRQRCFLTTLDQPFGLGVVDEGLYLYRLESEQRMFVVNGEHTEQLGPPGRVYRQKLPEWSFDVQTLPTIDLDVSYNIYGYIDLPVFEPDNGSCVGVLEIVSSSSYVVDYAFEVQEVSRALKEQNLKSPMVFENPRFVGDERRQHELDEIYPMLKTVCDLQKLPLAQMWALSGNSSIVVNSGNLESSCSSFNKNCIGKVCMSTSDLPFYVRDLSMWGFREACRERHLDKSQGIVGKSLTSGGLCFCKDVTKFGKEEYPLASYARGYEITSCLAIYLKSIESDIEYVTEFFLPPHNANKEDLQSLISTINQQIKNVSSVKLGILSSLQVIGGDPLNWNFESPPSPITLLTEKEEFLPEPQKLSVENEGNDVPFSKEESEVAYVEHMKDDNLEIELMDSVAAGTSQSIVPYLNSGIEDVDINKGKTETKNLNDKSNTLKRKKKKTGKSISMEQISKQYGKPMEEAAVNLGVSRSTLKRICRSLDIRWWPYKNNKSNFVLKSNETDAVIHASEGTPIPVLGTSTEPSGITNTEKTLMIKATYKEDMVKFPFMLLDGLVKLKELVATRFHDLSLGSFSLKYEDTEGDMILITCDLDLIELVADSRQPDNQTVIRLLVLPTAYEP